MLTRVATEEIDRSPEMRVVRRRLLEDAVTFYTDLLVTDPRDAEVYFERGNVYIALSRCDDAVRDYETAVEFDPAHAECHLALASAAGTPKDARIDFLAKALADFQAVAAWERPAVMERVIALDGTGRAHLMRGEKSGALRAFDAEGMLRGATLALTGDADARIRELFDRPEIAYIHAHNAAHGCFAARVERA